MKNKLTFVLALILVTTAASEGWAQDYRTLRARVGALYDQADRFLDSKDLEGFMSLLTDDYKSIFAGADRESIRSTLRVRLLGFDQLRAEHNVLEIIRYGNVIKVVTDQKLEGRSGETWKVISEGTVVDLLVQGYDSLKFARSAETDKTRLGNIVGQTYRGEKYSFTVPEDWIIIPSVHPTMRGTVSVLAADRSSAAVLGYVKLSGITGQQAVEGDEALGKLLSKEGTYKLFKSGPIRIGRYDGFESESEILLPSDRERHRRRVYFVAGDFLYAFCFDAIPFKQWDQVKDGFQSILNSVRIEE